MKEEANATSEMTFTELSPATTYTVAATPLDMYGIAGETKTLNVTTLSQPKVGDYYYSDGTWSDGGLVSHKPRRAPGPCGPQKNPRRSRARLSSGLSA